MFTRYSGRHLRPLFVIVFFSAVLRFTGPPGWMPFFGDQAWYFFSATEALFSGNLPLLGITASITWLHQGPLWTYLIIPVFTLTRFHPVAPALFMSFFSLISLPLAFHAGQMLKNRRAGYVYAALMGSFYFSVFHSRLAYHTSPIPFLFIITLVLLLKGRFFLGGLFLGLLYQSHLLTFIYWPLLILLSRKKQKHFNISAFLPGFALGILPFLLSGPIQTMGIFIWLAGRLVLGFGSVGLVSEAYLVVLSAPLLLLASCLFPRIGHGLLIRLIVLFFLANFVFLIRTAYLSSGARYGLSYSDKLQISEQIIRLSGTTIPQITIIGPGQEFATTSMPYEYLVWRKIWLGTAPSGHHSVFMVDENNGSVRVIK